MGFDMRLITIAIHTYDRALKVREILESEGIKVTLQNVNLESPGISSGVRIRIAESDLPLALRVLENPEIFNSKISSNIDMQVSPHSVIVPTDFSAHSRMAAMIAARIAAAHKVDMTLIYSYIDPHVSANLQLSDRLTYEIAGTTTRKLKEAATAKLDAFGASLKEAMKNGEIPVVRFNKVVVEGVPEDAIVDFTKGRSPYLVVMGTRSIKDKEKDMVGSVTAEVLDKCRFSVLSIPAAEHVDASYKPHNILFFSNLDQEDILAMDALYRFFPDSKARVTILHVPPRHRYTDKTAGMAATALSDYCSRTFDQYSFENIPLSPKLAIDELEKLQIERSFDLIVVPNRRKNAFTRIFNPGIAHRLLFHADIPMLVIPV